LQGSNFDQVVYCGFNACRIPKMASLYVPTCYQPHLQGISHIGLYCEQTACISNSGQCRA